MVQKVGLLTLIAKLNLVVKQIKQAHQLSTVFSSRISKGTSANLYRFGFVYQGGVFGKLDSTTNVTYDFMNAQQVGSQNRHIARVAQQLQYVVLSTNGTQKRNVVTLSGSGEGDWGSGGPPVYKQNSKIIISLMAGIDVPLSFTYTSFVQSTGKPDVKFQAALTFDFAKISRSVAH